MKQVHFYVLMFLVLLGTVANLHTQHINRTVVIDAVTHTCVNYKLREEIQDATRAKFAYEAFQSLEVREGYSDSHPDVGRGSLFIF